MLLQSGVTMYKLDNNPILYSHQIKILKLFFTTSFSKTFFLTGGTALSAFYLAHRESQDLDLFSLKPFDTLLLRNTMTEIAGKINAEMILNIRSQTFNEIILVNKKDSWSQKIDIVQEQPKQFGELTKIDNITIDSLLNIATNKILAVFGRLEPKDYIDLFFICTKTEYCFDQLFEKAKKKDTGLNEFYFANTIISVDKLESLPVMKIPFNKKEFVNFYQELSRKLLLKIKPEV